MYLLILILPLIGSIMIGLFGRFLGRYGASILSVLSVVMSFSFSLLAFYEVSFLKMVCYINLMD